MSSLPRFQPPGKRSRAIPRHPALPLPIPRPRMQIPPADQFRREPGDDARLPWRTRVDTGDGGDLDLYVPGEDDWPDEAPDAPSLAFAASLLPELAAIRDEAAEYVRSIVDPRRPLVGTPEVICLTCDARRQRLIVEINWESMLDALWYVEIALHPTLGRRPVGMGVTPWGAHGSPWPPVHVQLQLPRDRPEEPCEPE